MKYLLSLLMLMHLFCFGQLVPQNGVKPSKPKYIAIKNVSIYVSPSKRIEKGTILIQDNKIVNVGSLLVIPDDALVLDYSGKVILPTFIELNSTIGMPKLEKKQSPFPQAETSKQGAYYWCEAIHPEINAKNLYKFDESASKEMIQKGFGIVSTRQNDGVCQGFSVVYSLGSSDYSKHLIKTDNASYFSFYKGVSAQAYPSSQMGSIAVLRQALYDLDWYKKNSQLSKNYSLEALANQLDKSKLFVTKDRYEILRAEKIAKEFNLNFNYIGSGFEFEILPELKEIKSTFVLPLDFPNVFELKDPYRIKDIPLKDLKRWELAPSNPYLLSKNGNKIAFTAEKVSPQDFWKNIQLTIERGLSKEKVLEALTTVPAELLGISNEYGTLDKDKVVSFIVYDNDPFEKEATVLESWIQGEKIVYNTFSTVDVRGEYNLVVDNTYYTLLLSGERDKLKVTLSERPSVREIDEEVGQSKKRRKRISDYLSKELKKDSASFSPAVELSGTDLILNFTAKNERWSGTLNLHGKYNAKFGIIEGDALLPSGNWVKWSAIRNKGLKEINLKKSDSKKLIDANSWFPNMAYGFEEVPEKENVVIKNVTIWTNEQEPIIFNGAVIVENGKIKYVGKSDNLILPNNAKIIDGSGKILTSGIIDEHSHIAVSQGVNEFGLANTAEVNIADVLRADDISIYRQLSGGVTAAQLLHGSANPIGGQSALIKLKWGHFPNEFLIENAPKFIKFALGENVKQANMNEFNTSRFPQTRMGVEQFMYDAFFSAKNYDLLKKENPNSYRKDLRMEALSEILKQERFITCHSYLQHEINMMMMVADSIGFKMNTFTHGLDGYKIADKLKAHGAGISTFSDWWAYKYEVIDAIPFNAALVSKMGVVTALNSDDAEMGRRLNQEAAKVVKYGGVSELEAWKMVTLNPAKLLHLDDRMGSVKVGKDADLVLWNKNPLDIEAKVELTIVDGEILYDAERDKILQKKNKQEHARLVNKMMEAKQNGSKAIPYEKKHIHFDHCDTLLESLFNE